VSVAPFCDCCRSVPAAMGDDLCPACREIWTEQPCPVEGCRFEQTDEDGCGLARVQTAQEGIARWDAGCPVQRGCLASRRAESVVDGWVVEGTDG
jgi:hypothetical protein